jgi:phytoene dehydrogenase-like protein
MNDAYDAIVIGAGHNGLVAAAYLARAGLRVLVLERRELVGGAVVSEEVFPGFTFDTAAHHIGWLHPAVVRDLRLERRGLELMPCDPTVFAPTLDGGQLLLWRQPKDSVEAIRQHSKADADRWPAFTALVTEGAAFLESLYRQPPPDVLSRKTSDLWKLLRVRRRLRRLGRREMMEVLRLLPMTVRELLDEWFETDLLKGVLGAAGITGIFQGPMAAGTTYLFLHHHVGIRDGALRGAARVRGGVGNLTKALEAAARAHGAEIKTNTRVERVVIKDGRATGVALVSGEEIAATRVVSGADPRRTFLD